MYNNIRYINNNNIHFSYFTLTANDRIFDKLFKENRNWNDAKI